MHQLIKKAFTLIELLVVIAIIGILSGLIVVSIGGMTTKANIAKSQVFSNSLRNTLLLNLVSEWKMDDNYGINVTDSWSGKNGTLVGVNTLPTWKSGTDCVYNNCVEFDGSDDYMTVSNDSVFDVDNFTFSAWVYNGVGTVSYPTIFSRGISNPTGHYWVYTTGTNEKDLIWEFGNGTNFVNVGWVGALDNNVWQHVAFSYNQNNHTVELFVDGISKGKKVTTSSLKTSGGILYLGAYQGGSSSRFKGKIDNALFFNNEISSALIKQQYYAGLNRLLTSGQVSTGEYQDNIFKLSQYSANK